MPKESSFLSSLMAVLPSRRNMRFAFLASLLTVLGAVYITLNIKGMIVVVERQSLYAQQLESDDIHSSKENTKMDGTVPTKRIASKTESPNSFIPPNPAFLLYYNHAGYSNQVSGLQRAAQLAYKLNRTLIVPPVLPHAQEDNELFPNWESAVGRIQCDAHLEYEWLQDQARRQARLARQKEGKLARFPSFHSIMDFEALYNSTGLRVIDLDEFMQKTHKRSAPKMPLLFYKSHNTTLHAVCNANIDRNVTNYVNARECQMNPPHTYPELVEHIQQEMAKQHGTLKLHKGRSYMRDCRVVNIGSGFTLRNSFGKDPMAKAFTAFFDNYPLVEPWNRILKTLLKKTQQFSNDFIGVHVRTFDLKRNCEDSTTLYDNAAEQVLQRLTNHSSAATENDNSSKLVIIGRANKYSKKCLKQSLEQKLFENSKNKTEGNENTLPSMPTVVTVNDLIDEHEDKEKLEKWIDSIPMEVSTRYLVLDQLVLAMASNLVMQSAFGSTFQGIVVNRQKHRQENLEALGLTEV
ncbi:GDP-fucose protein O-fucosyltransferase [Nitzschia inconspicua]|uniref:GDP-fucose protein O-fucosyltransferase n=1 Tax=Nitzschia inconspicua TaxID=303405 RepID=A0A9K3KBK0_9STRA|nr:GDP-fucose protein O-fucosyltransferase [Nitzschia inconspicua]